jgi:hypothetical protein
MLARVKENVHVIGTEFSSPELLAKAARMCRHSFEHDVEVLHP